MPEKIVREVTVIDGFEWVHIFRTKQGTIVEIPCTEAEYNSLGEKNAKPPKNGELEWIESRNFIKLDKGKIQKDDAMKQGEDILLFNSSNKINGGDFILLSKKEYIPVLTDNGDGTATLTTSKVVTSSVNQVKKL
jgi:hypothetical protein